ncbi:PAC2 family protein [Nocardioides stalactiti]|uniref:PAC2 family protein n=1 Tax=Nocardioides stalactiti TaxID=2755356 RepID=UPI0028AF2E9D|nr:PAC2 family protein [Nocardioides stalactiti]
MTLTPPRLVHIVDDVPELEGIAGLRLVVALDGFLDAGNAGAIACRHLVAEGGSADGAGGVVVATFDVDQLHDYRARRPPMSFVRDHYEGYDAPRLVVRLLHDTGGTPYLLLHGPEPDIRWEAFCRAVLEVVERFSVDLVVGMGSVPMAVPHTRPIAITHHANNTDLLSGTSPWRGELRIPSSAQALLEVRLGEWGHDALGFVAHVPHYLAQLDYPRASLAVLGQVELAARLTIDLTDLATAAEEREEEIARYLSANAEIGEVVSALEQQYDAFARAEESGSSLLAEDKPLPTGEEIGQQFEQFLAGLERPDETGGTP